MKKKQPFQKALLYLIISIPLLFLAPLVLNIGFVALKKDGTYIWAHCGRNFSGRRYFMGGTCDCVAFKIL